MITPLDITYLRDSRLETTAHQLLELQKELLSFQIEVEYLKSQLRTQKAVAEFEAKLYSGIKKLFK